MCGAGTRHEKDRKSDNNVFVEEKSCVPPEIKLRTQISVTNNL